MRSMLIAAKRLKSLLRENLGHAVAKLPPVGRDQLEFLRRQSGRYLPNNSCRTVEQVAGVLAKILS